MSIYELLDEALLYVSGSHNNGNGRVCHLAVTTVKCRINVSTVVISKYERNGEFM